MLLPALVMLAVLVGVTVLLLGGSGKSQLPGGATSAQTASFDGAQLSPAAPAPPLSTLDNSQGQPVNLANYRGKAVFLTFLYTHCPDVCPLIASSLHTTIAELGPRAREVQLIAVSVDPRGDTPVSVAKFLQEHQLTGEMQYLIGSPSALASVWKAWNVGSARDVGNPQLVNHSALVYGIERKGQGDDHLRFELQSERNRQRRAGAAGQLAAQPLPLARDDASREGYQLKGISSKAYEHPADRAATAALKAIPHLDTVLRKIIEFGYERALRRGILGSSVRLGEDQLSACLARPRARLRDARPRARARPVPHAVPARQRPDDRRGQPIVVVHSELVQLLDPEELRGVFAHEAGHVLSDHVLYRTALVILLQLSSLPGIPVPLFPLRMALMEWFRAAELSCDRAAALVIRDPLAVCRTLMVIAAGAEAANLDLDVFMKQGQDYREKASPFDRFSRLLAT